MTDHSAQVGERVRRARRAKGLTQLELAEYVHRSERWVREVETGRLSLDRHSVIDRMCDVLSVDVSWLVGQPYTAGSPDVESGLHQVPALRTAIRRAGLILSGHPGISAIASPPLPAQLRRSVDRLNRHRQAADLPAVTAVLPGLVESVNSSLLAASEEDAPVVYRALVESLHVARVVLNQLGYHDLSWAAVEAAAVGAARLGDDLLQACSAWDRCGVLLHTGSLPETIAVAEAALGRLERHLGDPSPQMLSLWGALHLRIAIASSRRQDDVSTWQALHEAERTAARLGGDRNDFQTVFGPSNAHIHVVEAAVELDQPDRALTYAAQLDLSGVPSRERVVHHAIDMARAYGQLNRDADAVRALHAAAGVAPHYVHNHPMSRALVGHLLQRARPTAVEAGLGPLGHAMDLT